MQRRSQTCVEIVAIAALLAHIGYAGLLLWLPATPVVTTLTSSSVPSTTAKLHPPALPPTAPPKPEGLARSLEYARRHDETSTRSRLEDAFTERTHTDKLRTEQAHEETSHEESYHTDRAHIHSDAHTPSQHQHHTNRAHVHHEARTPTQHNHHTDSHRTSGDDAPAAADVAGGSHHTPAPVEAEVNATGCAWRNTADCLLTGRREPHLDIACREMVPPRRSGYCECSNGKVAGSFNCRDPKHFSCSQLCRRNRNSLLELEELMTNGADEATKHQHGAIPNNISDESTGKAASSKASAVFRRERFRDVVMAAERRAGSPTRSKPLPAAPTVVPSNHSLQHVHVEVPQKPHEESALQPQVSKKEVVMALPLKVSSFIPKLDLKASDLLSPDCPAANLGHLRTSNWTGGWDIRELNVIGERHSGTNWLTSMLAHTFDLQVKEGYTRFKHWFQTPARNSRYKGELKDKLAVFIVRNPYDYLRGMHREPFHAEFHGRLPWEEFLTHNWTLPRRVWSGDDTLTARQRECTNEEGFVPGEVIPCKKIVGIKMQFQRTFPVYETHPVTGKIFENIVAMRAAKLLSAVLALSWAPNVEFVRYEDLLADGAEGARRFMHALHKKYNLPCRKRGVVTRKPGPPNRVVRVSSLQGVETKTRVEAKLDEVEDLEYRATGRKPLEAHLSQSKLQSMDGTVPSSSALLPSKPKRPVKAVQVLYGTCDGRSFGSAESFTRFKGKWHSVDHNTLERRMFYAQPPNEDVRKRIRDINPLLNVQAEACWGYPPRTLTSNI